MTARNLQTSFQVSTAIGIQKFNSTFRRKKSNLLNKTDPSFGKDLKSVELSIFPKTDSAPKILLTHRKTSASLAIIF